MPAEKKESIDKMRSRMESILGTFVSLIQQDEHLRKFSNGKHIVMLYQITDLDLAFHTLFWDGEVIGGLSEPAEIPDVTLKMKAEVLDGVFTGRMNAMRAAMSGKLSFSGDTTKAMSLQRIQKDLNRLYTQAREKIGDPGDLTSIQVAPSEVQSPVSPMVRDQAIESAGDERDEIVAVVNALYVARLITATGGNVSVRCADKEDQVWITPSQMYKGGLRPENIVRIDLQGKALDAGANPPSSERLVHCAIYRRRPDVNAVVHTHAPQATVLALAKLPFLPISTEAAFIGEIPRVPFIMPGTQELADAVSEALGRGSAVLMQNHGLVVAASSLRRATDLSEIIESTAEKIVACYAVGKQPPVLPDEVLETLREIGEMMV
jgi:autoinducer 2 (AI-2) kinase